MGQIWSSMGLPSPFWSRMGSYLTEVGLGGTTGEFRRKDLRIAWLTRASGPDLSSWGWGFSFQRGPYRLEASYWCHRRIWRKCHSPQKRLTSLSGAHHKNCWRLMERLKTLGELLLSEKRVISHHLIFQTHQNFSRTLDWKINSPAEPSVYLSEYRIPLHYTSWTYSQLRTCRAIER